MWKKILQAHCPRSVHATETQHTMKVFNDILHLPENAIEHAAIALSHLLTDNKVDSNLLRSLVHLCQPTQPHSALEFVWNKPSLAVKSAVRSQLLEWVRESTMSVPTLLMPTDRLQFLNTVKGLLDPLPNEHD